MAAVSETRIYTSLFSTTVDDYRPELVDNVFNSIPHTWYMRNKGRGRDRGDGRGFRMQEGGARVKIPVVLGTNTNAKSYSKYETLIMAATDEITVGIEDLKQNACMVGISGEEMSQNRGVAAKRDLLRDKLDIAELALATELERQWVQGTAAGVKYLTAGNGGKDMLPLGYLIQKDPGTDSALIHSIQQTAEANWRNRAVRSTAGASAFKAFKKEVFNLYNQCSKGSTNDSPDLVEADQSYFELWESNLSENQRYGNYGDDDAAAAGFETVKIKAALMFWSDNVPNFGDAIGDAATTTQDATKSVAFFLNTRWLEIVVASDVNFIATPFQEPVDQDAIWAKLLFRGQQTIKQRRKFGLHYSVDTTII